jgi:predicted Fe-Mo cluster-binding NifX family protein
VRTVAIAVGSPPGLEAPVAPRLADTRHLLLVDPATLDWIRISNWLAGPQGDEGVAVARLLTGRNVQGVICGDYGLQTRHALEAEGVLPYLCRAGMTARAALDRLRRGRLGIQQPQRARSGPAGIRGGLARRR